MKNIQQWSSQLSLSASFVEWPCMICAVDSIPSLPDIEATLSSSMRKKRTNKFEKSKRTEKWREGGIDTSEKLQRKIIYRKIGYNMLHECKCVYVCMYDLFIYHKSNLSFLNRFFQFICPGNKQMHTHTYIQICTHLN